MRTIAGYRVDEKLRQADIAKKINVPTSSFSSFEAIASDEQKLKQIAKLIGVHKIAVVIEP